MNLLFDQNLSPCLITHLRDIYPDASHVSLLGLDRANDQDVWQYARDNEYTIVTKDSDFNESVITRGFPPKVVWIRRGNCTTSEIETILRSHWEDIKTFNEDPNLGIITLF